MRIALILFIILSSLLTVGCVSRTPPTINHEQVGGFFLRSITTGRLYGPFSGIEHPPAGAELRVLWVPLIRDTSDHKEASIGRISWKTDHKGQTLLPEKLHPIERKLARDNSFIQAVFKSKVGAMIRIEDDEIIHSWAVWRMDADEAVLVRSSDYNDMQEYVRFNQLQVHEALTSRKIKRVNLDVVSVHEMLEELEKQTADTLGDVAISFSVEGEEDEWTQVFRLRFQLGDLRVIDLLEYLSEVHGVMFRIDGNVIRLSPRRGISE